RGDDGSKVHPTQKPEALLHRIILATSRPGDTILDPFFGTGTTGAVAKRLGRHWIGIERDEGYAEAARARIAEVPAPDELDFAATPSRREQPRIPFGWVVERGLIRPGSRLFDARRRHEARVRADGTLYHSEITGSIHKVGAHLQGAPSCNGWAFWHVEHQGKPTSIDWFRQKLRAELH
ncbi:MAG: site-specific DNA-methyltransferase, partial [Bauldia litoralis]